MNMRTYKHTHFDTCAHKAEHINQINKFHIIAPVHLDACDTRAEREHIHTHSQANAHVTDVPNDAVAAAPVQIVKYAVWNEMHIAV